MPGDEEISYFGVTNARRPYRRFGIRQRDRLFHMYAIGQTGVGKSTLLETLALQDIHQGRGIAVIDPHGDLAERLVAGVPESRKADLVYLDAADPEQPYGYNPLRRVAPDKVPLAVSGLMEAFKMLWDEAWGVRMEHAFRNALYALIEAGDAVLPDVLRMFIDKRFQWNVLCRVRNEQVREFWRTEFRNYNPRYRQEMIAPIQNKVGAFLADPRLYRVFTGTPVDLHFRTLMDNQAVLIVNLSKGRLGADSANVLGSLLVTTLGLAALTRADTLQQERRDFFVYIDEFQSFTTLSVANMISELRKFRVGVILAHQHLGQLETQIRQAVLGNVGSIVCFRTGSEDAGLLARELEPVFDALDVINLPNQNVFLRLIIDGSPSRAFSATTLSPAWVRART